MKSSSRLDKKSIRQWHPMKNKPLRPGDVTAGSSKKVWWRCRKGHEWQAVINNVTRGRGCPYCAGKRVTEENSLRRAKPALARQWHPTKNGSLTPADVTRCSGKKVWWRCKKGHEWRAVIYSRSLLGSKCPYCIGRKAARI